MPINMECLSVIQTVTEHSASMLLTMQKQRPKPRVDKPQNRVEDLKTWFRQFRREKEANPRTENEDIELGQNRDLGRTRHAHPPASVADRELSTRDSSTTVLLRQPDTIGPPPKSARPTPDATTPTRVPKQQAANGNLITSFSLAKPTQSDKSGNKEPTQVTKSSYKSITKPHAGLRNEAETIRVGSKTITVLHGVKVPDDLQRWYDEFEPHLRQLMLLYAGASERVNEIHMVSKRSLFGTESRELQATVIIRTKPEDLKTTKDWVKQSEAVKDLFEDKGIHTEVVPDKTIRAMGMYTLDERSGDGRTFGVDAKLEGPDIVLSGAKLTIDPRLTGSTDAFALSTLGGLLFVDEQLYGITVSHSMCALLGENRMEVPSVTFGAKLNLSTQPLGYVHSYRLLEPSSRRPSSYNADWALIYIDAQRMRSNSAFSILRKGLMRQRLLDGRLRCDIHTSRGCIPGWINGGISSLYLGGSLFEAYRIELVTSLAAGDSGAWVTINDGQLCGTMIAGRDQPPTGYMIAIEDTFNSIAQTLSVKSVRLPTWNEARLLELNLYASNLVSEEARALLEWHPAYAWLKLGKHEVRHRSEDRSSLHDPASGREAHGNWTPGSETLETTFTADFAPSYYEAYSRDLYDVSFSAVCDMLLRSSRSSVDILDLVGHACMAVSRKRAVEIQRSGLKLPFNLPGWLGDTRTLNNPTGHNAIALLFSLKGHMTTASIAELMLLILEQINVPVVLLPPRYRVEVMVKFIFRIYSPYSQPLEHAPDLHTKASHSGTLGTQVLDQVDLHMFTRAISRLKQLHSATGPSALFYQGPLTNWITTYASLTGNIPLVILPQSVTEAEDISTGHILGWDSINRLTAPRVLYIFRAGDAELAEMVDMPLVDWTKLKAQLVNIEPLPQLKPRVRPDIELGNHIEYVDLREPHIDDEAYSQELPAKSDNQPESVRDTSTSLESDKGHEKGALSLPLSSAIREVHETETEDKTGAKDDLDDQLYYASRNGNEELVRELIQKGAGVNNWIRPPLEVASMQGYNGIVKILLEAGANPNLKSGPLDSNALEAAATYDQEVTVRKLLEAGADVNLKGGKNNNALHAGIVGGHAKIVRVLLDAGADISSTDRRGQTALVSACEQGFFNIVSTLISCGADINAEGGAALQMACVRTHSEIVRLLIEKGADVNAIGGPFGNPLVAAASGGQESIILLLLGLGLDVNVYGDHGSALHEASTKGKLPVVKLLLENGADVKVIGGSYGTPLIAAVSSGREAIVKLLLQNGAEINARGDRGTALQLALTMGYNRLAEVLIEAGAERVPESPDQALAEKENDEERARGEQA